MTRVGATGGPFALVEPEVSRQHARAWQPGDLAPQHLSAVAAVRALGGLIPPGEGGLFLAIAQLWPRDQRPRLLLGPCRERLDRYVREGVLVGSVHHGYRLSPEAERLAPREAPRA